MKYVITKKGRSLIGFLCLSVMMWSCRYDIKDIGPKASASFTATPIAGQTNKYLLTSTSTNAFIYEWNKADGKDFVRTGVTDTAYFSDKGTYTVKLRVYGPGGIDSAAQTITVASDDPAAYTPFKLLTAHSWKLNPDPASNAIIVGTEANPAAYYAGGPLVACQSDDVYTFAANNTLTYKANGATYNAGNIAPNYTCGADRSYSNVAFTFSNTIGAGLAGIATIQLPGTPPTNFIGVTDVPAENVYRIISISPTAMVLRAGNGSGTIFQFKFIAQ
jgi:PKD repeat protein